MHQHLIGCLWGTALGDALGLCREGLSPARGQRLYPDLTRFQLFGGRGLASDDTEHAAFTAWAIHGHPDPSTFQRRLRHALRRWIACLPAGVGLATLRASILAVAGPENLEPYLEISTRLTHTDPRALERTRQIASISLVNHQRILAEASPNRATQALVRLSRWCWQMVCRARCISSLLTRSVIWKNPAVVALP